MAVVRNESGREVEDEVFIASHGLLSKGEDGRHADGEMVPLDVVDLGCLDNLPYMRLAQMVDGVLICSSLGSAKAAVMAGDDDAAAASGSGLVELELGVDARLLTLLD